MRRALVLPFIALAAPAGAEDSYPARAVLGAFATACSGIEEIPVARASALAAGWQEFEPAADSQIGRIVGNGLALATEDPAAGPETEALVGGSFRRQVAGRELFLVISGMRDGDIASYGCRLFDLAAPAPIAADALEDWAVRAPAEQPTGIPGMTRHVWNPGLKPGHMEMAVSFVPQGTVLPEPLAGIPLSGLVFTATAVEFFDS